MLIIKLCVLGESQLNRNLYDVISNGVYGVIVISFDWDYFGYMNL